MLRDGLKAEKLDLNFVASLSQEEKRDLADRLNRAGYKTSSEKKEVSSVLKLFAEDKGLKKNLSKNKLWIELTNFGYELGDRLLNLSTPSLYGSDIEELQEFLSRLGFYSGTHTSVYSKDLEIGVQKFQENRSLAIDGNVGPDTVKELKSLQRPGERHSLNNAINMIGYRELFFSKQKHTVCFYIPYIKDYKIMTKLYGNVRKSCIESNINPIFASDISKEISTDSAIGFVNKIQPSYFIVLSESKSNDVSFFEGKHSESKMGKILSKGIAKNLNMEIRGSSSKILTKTKSTTVIISIGNNYQNFNTKNICSAIVSTTEKIGKNLA